MRIHTHTHIQACAHTWRNFILWTYRFKLARKPFEYFRIGSSSTEFGGEETGMVKLSLASIRSRFNLSPDSGTRGAVCSFGLLYFNFIHLPRFSLARSQSVSHPAAEPRNSWKKQEGVGIYIMVIRTNYVSSAFRRGPLPIHSSSRALFPRYPLCVFLASYDSFSWLFIPHIYIALRSWSSTTSYGTARLTTDLGESLLYTYVRNEMRRRVSFRHTNRHMH